MTLSQLIKLVGSEALEYEIIISSHAKPSGPGYIGKSIAPEQVSVDHTNKQIHIWIE